MTNPDIFISYRITDSKPDALLLFTKLANHFGEEAVFLDKARLESGMDWPDELEANVQKAKVLLVLIKDESKWLDVKRLGGRRMDDPKDWVRREIETALSAGKTVIPILVDGASLPPTEDLPASLHDLIRKQGRKIAIESTSDIAALFADLEKCGLRKKQGPVTAPVHPLSEYPLPADVPDPLDHHPAPFLGLPFFSRTAARLFFGRTREILEFFSLAENPDIRLISLFGHSGVGKSSLLAAGILPRLDIARKPYYNRREKTKGLGKQLAKLRQETKTAGKPPVYILDQVEEVFTDPLPGEPDDFVRSLRATVREEPEATIVLGFRSDYQLDVSDLLSRVDCRQVDLPLRPLGHAALVEAVEGVWLDSVLSKRYALELEKGFADFVARNLMHTESGGAAAILQNRLLKLYNQAKVRRTPAYPLIQLRIADYEELSRNAVAEEELLDFQIQRLREAIGEDTPDEKTILETLDRFVLDKPTAGTLSKNSLPDDPKKLRDALRRVNLLTELHESQAIRLSHDLLAPIVRRRYSQFLVTESERLEIENVRLRLRQVLECLTSLDFAEALEELRGASLRNIVPEEVWPLTFELAFIFLQAKKRENGVFALLKCATYMNFAKIILPPFPDKSFPDNRDYPELLDYLRRCDPALFIKMERRYFPTMIRVEGGTFEMGDVLDDNEYENEKPVHKVTLSTFELAATPITWQQYGLFCLATDSLLPYDEDWGRGERPIINVSWYDAVEYANWLSQARGCQAVYQIDKDRKDPNNHSERDELKWSVVTDFRAAGFRLPTEVEWEFAARERGRPVRFGNGKNIADSAEMNFNAGFSHGNKGALLFANGDRSFETYKENHLVIGEYRKKTTPVRQFSPNALGFFDMSGNVWEWCYDWYGEYPEEHQTNPAGLKQGDHRVARGCSWEDLAHHGRVAMRSDSGAMRPSSRFHGIGFRLALQSVD